MTDDWMVLAGDFEAPTQADWDREVLKALNRRRPPGSELTIEQAMKRLTTVLVDGVEIKPLYLKPDDQQIGYPAQPPFTRGACAAGPNPAWVIAQLHEDPDLNRTQTGIDADLNAGATGVWLRVDDDAIAAADIPAILEAVQPEAAEILISSNAQQTQAAEALLSFWAASGKTAVRGSLGIDPLASSAITGLPAEMSNLAQWVDKAKPYPMVLPLVVDATVYDNAGAGDIDQLSFAIASGIEYVRALESQGIATAEGFTKILFRVTASADQMLTIARLRALRRLWARVGEVLEVPELNRGAFQHAVTSWRTITKDDPWVNLLRATVGAFSATVGGAEYITTLPHDTAYGLPTTFSRRIARNIQLLIGEEAHVGAVEDPAGGAWAIEDLSEQLANKAWTRLQEIETQGGMGQALASSQVAQWLDATCAERAKRLATRKIALTGVSMFPKQDEEPLTDFIPRPARPAYDGLAFHRDSEAFEALRDRSRAHAQITGDKPTLVLALLGARRDFGPREQFTSNLLLAAGLGYAAPEGPTPQQIVEAAAKSGTHMVILASSTKVYADQALAAAQAAKEAGLQVWIAGRKTEVGDEQADDLIDGEIFDGMDTITFLNNTLDQLGVAK